MRFGLKNSYESFVYGVNDASDLVRIAVEEAGYAENRDTRAEQILLKQHEIMGRLIEHVCGGDRTKMLDIVGLGGMDIVKHPQD